ncbi:MAG: BlaI/MecI/CopY family transcriptional regulator [Peptococcaceae bacterium]|nr:BlaI/MecI/CopY family transcriptional regulator [Peptococcaceae bacterium]
MENLKRLPDSELKLMMIIWDAGEPVASPYILEKLVGQKTWAKTTVLNFLSRLVDRGFLATEKRGRFHFFSPAVSKEDYLQMESASFLDRVHQNSLKSLIASLYDSKAITDSDLKELRQYVDQIAENK